MPSPKLELWRLFGSPVPTQTMFGSDWQTALQILTEGGLLDQKVQAEEVFINDLIDKSIVADIGNGKF